MPEIVLDISGPLSAEVTVRELKRHKQSGKVLDIGTGKGIAVQVFREHGYDAYGIDVRDVFEESVRPYCRVADITRIPDGDASYDVVTEAFVFAHGVEIERWPDTKHLGVFKEVNRVLRPGGLLVSSWVGKRIPAWGTELLWHGALTNGMKPVLAKDRSILVFQRPA